MSSRIANIYIVCWSVILILALVFALTGRSFAIRSNRYWRWLLRPWKLITFLVAITGMMVVAPFTGDPTWDYVDSGVQAILTFTSAPWVVGTMTRFILRGRYQFSVTWRELYCAVSTWLFSASWFYDGYIYWRDGFYPFAWSSNLIASSLLYFSGGAFWSLTRNKNGKISQAFLSDDWPTLGDAPFRSIAIIAIPLMAFVTALLSPFLIEAFRRVSAR